MKHIKVTNKLWLISDTHFGHSNIIRYQQRPTNHEVIMLSEWIRALDEEDDILHLGDVALGKGGNAYRWLDVIERLPGTKFLILGNHDKKASVYERVGFTVIPEFTHRHIRFTHKPEQDPTGWSINIHGHTHGNAWRPEHDGVMYEDKTYINMSVEVRDFKPVRLGNVAPL